MGKKEDACCVAFESFAYLNLGYEDLKELGPGEIVEMCIRDSVKKGAFLKFRGVTTVDRFDSELTIASIAGIKKIAKDVYKRQHWFRE